MAKPNYQFEKRQKELAKKNKQEAKRQQKLADKAAGIVSDDSEADDDDVIETPATDTTPKA